MDALARSRPNGDFVFCLSSIEHWTVELTSLRRISHPQAGGRNFDHGSRPQSAGPRPAVFQMATLAALVAEPAMDRAPDLRVEREFAGTHSAAHGYVVAPHVVLRNYTIYTSWR
jgi:hypothetical protein